MYKKGREIRQKSVSTEVMIIIYYSHDNMFFACRHCALEYKQYIIPGPKNASLSRSALHETEAKTSRYVWANTEGALEGTRRFRESTARSGYERGDVARAVKKSWTTTCIPYYNVRAQLPADFATSSELDLAKREARKRGREGRQTSTRRRALGAQAACRDGLHAPWERHKLPCAPKRRWPCSIHVLSHIAAAVVLQTEPRARGDFACARWYDVVVLMLEARVQFGNYFSQDVSLDDFLQYTHLHTGDDAPEWDARRVAGDAVRVCGRGDGKARHARHCCSLPLGPALLLRLQCLPFFVK